jgi:hypothetical protein
MRKKKYSSGLNVFHVTNIGGTTQKRGLRFRRVGGPPPASRTDQQLMNSQVDLRADRSGTRRDTTLVAADDRSVSRFACLDRINLFKLKFALSRLDPRLRQGRRVD